MSSSSSGSTADSSTSEQTVVASLLPAAYAALRNRAEAHGGVPVGALLVPTACAAQCRDRLETEFGKLKLLGTDTLGPGVLLLHLPRMVAGAFEDLSAVPAERSMTLKRIAADAGAAFLAGVRTRDPLLSRPLPPICGTRDNEGDAMLSGLARPRFTFAECFAGIGGFRLALEPLGGRCVFASEVDAAACQIYKGAWPQRGPGPLELLVGDITGVYASQLPPMDILTAGFPCQPFSDRGKRPGLVDERGQLYRELIRLLLAHQPPCFLFENVSGLVTMGGGSRSQRGERRAADLASSLADAEDLFSPGAVFSGLLLEFAACGYNVSWRVLSARYWLPQHRERVYIVGFRTDLGLHMDWAAVRSDSSESTVRPLLEPASSEAVHAAELTEAQWARLQAQCESYPRWGGRPCTMDERAANLDGAVPTLTSSYRVGGSVTSKFIFEERDGTRRDGGLTHHSGEQDELGNPKGGIKTASVLRPRFYTPRECCRLMGFPDTFPVPSAKHGPKALGAFYRAIGNAVCPPVLEAIGKEMVRLLESHSSRASEH